MIRLKKGKNTPRFVPDYMATSLQDVDFAELKKRGIRYIAFDADSTLVPFRGKSLTPGTKRFLHRQQKLFDRWCIASNRITNDLLPLAESMDAHVVRATILNRKPQKRFFRQVLRHLGGKPSETAMIGDKLIADMFGAKRHGMTTVWVKRIGQDNPLDRLFGVRHFEQRLMKNYLPGKDT